MWLDPVRLTGHDGHLVSQIDDQRLLSHMLDPVKELFRSFAWTGGSSRMRCIRGSICPTGSVTGG